MAFGAAAGCKADFVGLPDRRVCTERKEKERRWTKFAAGAGSPPRISASLELRSIPETYNQGSGARDRGLACVAHHSASGFSRPLLNSKPPPFLSSFGL